MTVTISDGNYVFTPAPVKTTNGFPFMLENDIITQKPQEYLIEDWVPEKASLITWGLPKEGKSFAVLHMAMCITHGMPWYGHEVKQGAVLYVAAEGAGGFGKRVRAWKKHHAAQASSPLVTITVPVNLADDDDASKLIRQAQQMEQDYGFKFVMIVFDTYARCTSGSDENSNTSAGLAVASVDRIREEVSAAVMIVHHAGKNEANGPRGASALFGAVDSSFHVEREKHHGKHTQVVTLSNDKQKDDEEAATKRLLLTQVDLDPKTNGKPQNSCVLLDRMEEMQEAMPNLGGIAKIDPVYNDLVLIATQLTPDTTATVSTTALIVFRSKKHTDRVIEALPLNEWRKVTTSEGVRAVRRVKANGTKGDVVQCQIPHFGR